MTQRELYHIELMLKYVVAQKNTLNNADSSVGWRMFFHGGSIDPSLFQ